MIEIILVLIGLGVVLLITYLLGRKDGIESAEADGILELLSLENDLQRSRKAQHNLHGVVYDLKFDLAESHRCIRDNTADALAYGTCVGLWATDQPDLIRHHAKKERFFRIGHPEHKL